MWRPAFTAATGGVLSDARGPIAARSAAAVSGDRNAGSLIATNAGSASNVLRRAYAIRSTSATVWIACGECQPIARRSMPPRMFAISAIVSPPDDTGGIEITRCPRYVNSTGLRHSARYRVRSSRPITPLLRRISATIRSAVGPA